MITIKIQDLYTKTLRKNINFQQMRMKLYTTITKSKILMDLVILFIRLLVQRFLVFSSKRVLLHKARHHFSHLSLLSYRSFLLITSPILSSFCKCVSYIQCGLLSSLYFCIQNMVGFIAYAFIVQWAYSFHLCFLVVTTSFDR